MNQLTQLYGYLKQLAEADTLVNHVTKSNAMNVDKEILTPVVAINISSGGFTNGSTLTFSVELSAFSQRDINKEIVDDDFWGNDNEVDNQNTCIAILNRMWTKMYLDFEDNNITASENPSFEIGSFEGMKLLDGARLTFEVEIPNTTISLCQ
jgi:hypothetical protein